MARSKFIFLLVTLLTTLHLTVFAQNKSSVLAITGARIYTTPYQEPIEKGIVIVENGIIKAVGPWGKIKIPKKAKILKADGLSLVAGFWNCHVHLMEEKWNNAAGQSKEELEKKMEEMFLRYGFTTIIDLATLHKENLLDLAQRVTKENLRSPEILYAGEPFVAENGSPLYIAPLRLREVKNKRDVELHINEQVKAGASLIKIWSASPAKKGIVSLSDSLIAHASLIAGKYGLAVAAHPTNIRGADLAISNGVKILVHTSPDDRLPFPDSLVEKMIKKQVVLMPTLQMIKWELERFNVPSKNDPLLQTGITQLSQFFKAGGTIVFGTDVGYMTVYDPADEYVFMQQAGMDYKAILASLTIAPAQVFGKQKETGTIEAGKKAQLLLLKEDPAKSISAFTNIAYTIQNGEIIFRKQ